MLATILITVAITTPLVLFAAYVWLVWYINKGVMR